MEGHGREACAQSGKGFWTMPGRDRGRLGFAGDLYLFPHDFLPVADVVALHPAFPLRERDPMKTSRLLSCLLLTTGFLTSPALAARKHRAPKIAVVAPDPGM